MGKIISFIKTNTSARNLAFLITEAVLVVAIAASGSAIVMSSGMRKNYTDPKNNAASRVASAPLEEEEAFDEEWPSYEPEESTLAFGRANPRSKDTYEIPTGITYDRDDFLPKMAEPAKVLDTWVRRGLSNEEELMFTSLQGLVNSRQPRIYTSPVDPSETANDWQNIFNLKFNEPGDPYELISKYRDEIRGIIVYDDSNITVIDTANLANTMATVERGIAVSPKLLPKLAKFNLPIIADLRGKFSDKWEIYSWMFDNYASRTSQKIIIGINPNGVYGFIRDYAMAAKACIIWLDPEMDQDVEEMNKYMKRMVQDGATYLGWWPQEQEGVRYAADYGVVTLAADWSRNLSYFSGSQTEPKKQADGYYPIQKIENKVYVSLIQSDGDNMQYMQGRMLGCWLQQERGDFPLAWTSTPCSSILAPDIWNYYVSTMDPYNDALVSGPSGFGYFYPQRWVKYKDDGTSIVSDGLKTHLSKTDKLMARLGMKTITVWNSSDGAMTRQVKNGYDYLQLFADYMPSLIGITQQEHDGGTELSDGYVGTTPKWDFTDSPAVYKSKSDLRWRHQNVALETGVNGNKFLAIHLAAAYDESPAGLKMVARRCIEDWDGKQPLFLGLQGVPWAELGGMEVFQDVMQYINLLTPQAEFIRLDQMMNMQTRMVESGEYKKIQDANRN